MSDIVFVVSAARENPRLHFNAIEPGLNLTTGLGGADAGAFVRFLQKFVMPLLVPLLMPFMKILSTPKRAARVITKVLMNESGVAGIYYDESGRPMQGSTLVVTRSSRTVSSLKSAGIVE